MTIDVILPTYNRREFLPRAIACIRRQTFADWRLIVINDGGEDVADIVNDCGDGRIVYFDRPHAGKAAQLNFALSRVSAEYVAYMDDDDDVFPEHLEKLLGAARRTGADFVYSDTYLTILDAQGQVVSREVENAEDAPFDEIRVFNRINHKQILHTRALGERVGGYDESMRILIDFDFIKRLSGAARRPFHLREITGEHFLRTDPKSGTFSSISGIWEKDPEAAGRSLLSFFAKDPVALKMLYRSAYDWRQQVVRQKERRSRSLKARLRRFFGLGGRDEPGSFHDALTPACDWRDMPMPGGFCGFLRMADESFGAIEAVNRIADGDRSRAVRARAFSSEGFPPVVARPKFGMEDVGRGVRFVHAAGSPHRWVVLTTATPLPRDFALEFDYTPHSVFKEQLQFDFHMTSFGDRLRFMVRNNEALVANAVEKGRFMPDARRVPFSFGLHETARIRISSCGGVCTFAADGRELLSLAYEGPVGKRGGYASFVFYDSDAAHPIDFEIANLKFGVRP